MSETRDIVVCNACGQALRIVTGFTAQGPILPEGYYVIVIDPHSCPRTLN